MSNGVSDTNHLWRPSPNVCAWVLGLYFWSRSGFTVALKCVRLGEPGGQAVGSPRSVHTLLACRSHMPWLTFRAHPPMIRRLVCGQFRPGRWRYGFVEIRASIAWGFCSALSCERGTSATSGSALRPRLVHKCEAVGGTRISSRTENLSLCHFLHQKFHLTWPGIELGPQWWEAGHKPPELWHGLEVLLLHILWMLHRQSAVHGTKNWFVYFSTRCSRAPSCHVMKPAPHEHTRE